MTPFATGAEAPTTTIADSHDSVRQRIGQSEKAAVEIAGDTDGARCGMGTADLIDRPETCGTRPGR